MSSEITVRCGLTIRKVSGALVLIDYNKQFGFQGDLTGTLGPTPGAFTVSTTGTDVSLAQIGTPGWATFKNLDATNFVTWGIYEPDTTNFYPVGELGPGEGYPIKLSRYLGEQFYLPPTGTGTENNTLRFVADTAACVVSCEIFER